MWNNWGCEIFTKWTTVGAAIENIYIDAEISR